MTKILGHNFVKTPFVLKFVPPGLFLGVQTMLVPMIYMKGTWTTAVWVRHQHAGHGGGRDIGHHR